MQADPDDAVSSNSSRYASAAIKKDSITAYDLNNMRAVSQTGVRENERDTRPKTQLDFSRSGTNFGVEAADHVQLRNYS